MVPDMLSLRHPQMQFDIMVLALLTHVGQFFRQQFHIYIAKVVGKLPVFRLHVPGRVHLLSRFLLRRRTVENGAETETGLPFRRRIDKLMEMSLIQGRYGAPQGNDRPHTVQLILGCP